MTSRRTRGTQTAMQPPAQAHPAPPRRPGKPLRHLLIVEDDADQSDVLRAYFETMGYQVSTAGNGVEALKLIMREEYDAVLCDVVMPSMPGDMLYEAVRRVRPKQCERFVFITGHSGHPRVLEFLTSFTETVVVKPFHPDDLMEVLRQLWRDLEEGTKTIIREEELDTQHLPRLKPPGNDTQPGQV